VEGEEGLELRLRAEEEHPALVEQHHVGEHLEDLLARLMDGSDHQTVVHRQLLQEFHDVVGRVSVQTRRRLVKEQDLCQSVRPLALVHVC
jgi:hypothetical protein